MAAGPVVPGSCGPLKKCNVQYEQGKKEKEKKRRRATGSRKGITARLARWRDWVEVAGSF